MRIPIGWVLIVMIIVGFGYSIMKSSDMLLVELSENMTRMDHSSIERAVIAAEGAIEGLPNFGHINWIPTQAGTEALKILNATRQSLSAEDAQHNEAGLKFKPTEYVVDEPTAAGQVVLIPNDSEGVIIIKGYGKDLSEPLIEKTVHVSF